eukprot:494138-Amphidinium_carterae.1
MQRNTIRDFFHIVRWIGLPHSRVVVSKADAFQHLCSGVGYSYGLLVGLLLSAQSPAFMPIAIFVIAVIL